VQFSVLSSNPPNDEKWHGNGVASFTTANGTSILAVTHRNLNEAILMTHPWLTNGGDGAVVQRFGLLQNGLSPVAHAFGLTAADAEAAWTGLHNVRYALGPDGRESLVVFVNGKVGSNYSWVYEFNLRLVPEDETSGDPPSDAVFDTTYWSAPCPFFADAQGGARSIGHTAGAQVWLAASGVAGVGLACVDAAGGSSLFAASVLGIYDPFTFVAVGGGSGA
jgi:hypothetical protein